MHKSIGIRTVFVAISNDFIDRYVHDRASSPHDVCHRRQCVRRSMLAGRDRCARAVRASARIAIRSRSELQTTDRTFVDQTEVNSIVILVAVPIKNRGYS
ncbi:hypothetical protein [Burkholderia sp. Bp8998]|uniref:hypothetical protein n=1 Tax=Burkholderia sp. Bp8998 TaxID=2184557 RepID=UPI000F5ABD53|nr:hypothetical protein [Burkholderia sp. Bp8998]